MIILIEMFSEEQSSSGLTSLFSNDSSITFPSEKRDNFDVEPRIPRPTTRRPVSVASHRRSSPRGESCVGTLKISQDQGCIF